MLLLVYKCEFIPASVSQPAAIHLHSVLDLPLCLSPPPSIGVIRHFLGDQQYLRFCYLFFILLKRSLLQNLLSLQPRCLTDLTGKFCFHSGGREEGSWPRHPNCRNFFVSKVMVRVVSFSLLTNYCSVNKTISFGDLFFFFQLCLTTKHVLLS